MQKSGYNKITLLLQLRFFKLHKLKRMVWVLILLKKRKILSNQKKHTGKGQVDREINCA